MDGAWTHLCLPGVTVYYCTMQTIQLTFVLSTRNRMLLIILEECTFTILHWDRCWYWDWTGGYLHFLSFKPVDIYSWYTHIDICEVQCPPQQSGLWFNSGVWRGVLGSSWSCSVASSRQWPVLGGQNPGPGTRTLVIYQAQVQVNSQSAVVVALWPTPSLASNTHRQHPVLLLVQGEARTAPTQRNCQCFVKADKCAAADTCHTIMTDNVAVVFN